MVAPADALPVAAPPLSQHVEARRKRCTYSLGTNDKAEAILYNSLGVQLIRISKEREERVLH